MATTGKELIGHIQTSKELVGIDSIIANWRIELEGHIANSTDRVLYAYLGELSRRMLNVQQQLEKESKTV